jgi:PAS domain S-box-containing protein
MELIADDPLYEEFGVELDEVGLLLTPEVSTATDRLVGRTAFDQAAIGMALVDLDGRFLRVNAALCALTGYPNGELLAKTVSDVTHPDDLEADLAQTRRLLAGELGTYQLEKRYVRKDGEIVWGRLSRSLVRDGGGEPLHFVSQVDDITSRMLVASELAAAERQRRDLLERISDGFLGLDDAWRIAHANAAAEQFIGRDRSSLVGEGVREVLPPELQSSLLAAHEKAVRGDEPAGIEHYDEALGRWLEVRVHPTATGVSVFLRDVTRRKTLEQELRAAEATYRSLVEHVPAVFYLVAADAHQTPLFFSPYFEQLTGYRPQEVLRQPGHWRDHIHPGDRDDARKLVDEAIAGGRPFQADYRYVRKDGRVVWIRDETVPVRDLDGGLVAWQGVLLDISERVAAEETAARLAAIVESTRDAVVSRTLEGTVTSWNRGAEQLFGYRAVEVLGQHVGMLMPEDRAPLTRDELVATGLQWSTFETRRRRKDGTVFDASITMSPIVDYRGETVGVSSITRDISERKRLERGRQNALTAAQDVARE